MDNTCEVCGFRSSANTCRISGDAVDVNNECVNGAFFDEEFFFDKSPADQATTIANVKAMVG